MKDLLLTTRVGLVETVANGEVLKIIEGDHSLFVSNFEETISVKGAVKDVYQGPFEFDLVTVNEGGLHEELKDSTVSEVERWSSVDELSWTEDVGVDISSLSEGEDGDVARESLRRITHLANIGDGEREPRLRRLYKQEIRSLLLDQVEKHPIDPDCRVIVPLRAALPAAALMGVEPDQIMEVEEKRLAFKAGNIFTGKKDLAVGISMIDEMGWEDFLSLDGQEANVVEGCIATGFTVTQLFQVGLSMGMKPEKINIYAGAITQQGAEAIIGFCQENDIAVSIYAGGISYVLDGDCYLRTEDGKDYFVGDAGDFLWSAEGDVWTNEETGHSILVTQVCGDSQDELMVDYYIDGEKEDSVHWGVLDLYADRAWREELDETRALTAVGAAVV